MQTTQNMPQQPLISFIVTDYNIPEEMLDECLGSLSDLSLNEAEYEIILVDDGSTVSPLTGMATIESRKDNIVYVRQRNQGLSSARNTGLKMASGKYVHFIDGDDFLLRAPYEHCLDIVRYHNPDIVLFDSTNRQKAAPTFTYEGPMGGSEFLHNHNLRAAAWGYIFRRSILGPLRFTPGLLHEDEEFTPQLVLRADRVFLTSAKAYYYRRREGSIMTSKEPAVKQKRLADSLKIITRLQDLAQRLPHQEKIALERRVNQLAMDLLYNTIRENHSHESLEQAIEALRNIGLFPLPDMKYTRKYSLFRRMMNSSLGRSALMIGIR